MLKMFLYLFLIDVIAEIGTAPADPTSHIGGAEHWKNQVQSFRFGWPPDRSPCVERLLC